MKVEAGERMREDIDVLVVDHPDSFVHSVPEEVLEGNVRGTEEATLGLEGNMDLWASGTTFQGLSRVQYEASRYMIELRTYPIYITFQCDGVGERDWGLTHAEEAVLDASAAYRADPISLRKRTSQHHLNGIGNEVDGDIGATSLLLDGEVGLGDPSVERRRRNVFHNQICTANSIAEDVEHFGHMEIEFRQLSLSIEVCLGARLGPQARVSTFDEDLRAENGWDYIRSGALGAQFNDVSLLHTIHQY